MDEIYWNMAEPVLDDGIITRFSPPTQWDKHVRGTVVRVVLQDDFDEEHWIQRSSDENNPLWEKI